MTLFNQPQTEAVCSTVLSHSVAVLDQFDWGGGPAGDYHLMLNTSLLHFNLEATISIVSTDVATTCLHANPSLNIH